SDMAGKASVVRGTASALPVEIADETTAALIAHNARAKKYCRLAGGKHVVVLQTDYRAFRSALKKLGSSFPTQREPRTQQDRCRADSANGGAFSAEWLPIQFMKQFGYSTAVAKPSTESPS